MVWPSSKIWPPFLDLMLDSNPAIQSRRSNMTLCRYYGSVYSVMLSCGTKRLQTFFWAAEEQVVMSKYLPRFQVVVTRSTFKFREIWCRPTSVHPAVVRLHVCDGTGIIWCPHQCLPVASQIYWTHRLQEAQPIVGLIYPLLQMLDFSPPTLRCWQLGNDV